MNPAITPRIVECLTLRAAGLLSKQIADAMHISERTVDEHFREAKRVTNSKSSHHLIARFVMGEIATRPGRVKKAKKPVKKLPKD